MKDAGQDTWVTYHHINERANRLARCLLKRLHSNACLNPDGDRVVAVCMAPTTHLVTALLAIHKAGAAYLPLDVTFPESRVAHILNDSKPGLLLAKGHPQAVHGAHTNPQVENNVPVLHLEDLRVEMDNEKGDDLSPEEVGLTLSGASIATILYTSGSTGIPKGVRVSHRAVLNRLTWQWLTFPYQKDEICCFKTALTFVDSISEIFGPLLTGRQVVVIPKEVTRAVDELVEVLERECVGRLVLVPSLLRSILLLCSTHDVPRLAALRLWVCSGEVFPTDLLHSFFVTFTSGQTICNFYGSTEVMGDVTYLQFHNSGDVDLKLVNRKVPIGSPIMNCWIYLLDADGEEVKDGHIGEVYAGGLSVASGYVGGAQPDKFIADRYTDDPEWSILYRTGDFGRIVNGVLVFEGRVDSQIKIRGHRVDMNEVEIALHKVKGVDKAYILCYNSGEVNQALVAFYTSHDDELVPEVLKLQLASHLQPYMQPQLIYVEDLPLLVNGKVDRQQLLKIYEEKTSGNQEGVEIDLTGVSPEDEAKALALLLTVARVLGPTLTRGTKLSISTSFFEIGGNSLNSVLTVTYLQDLGYSIGIGQFMKAEVLGDISRMMEINKQSNSLVTKACTLATEDHQYSCSILNHSHKDAVLTLLSESFAQKGDLEQWVHSEPWEYVQMLNQMFDYLVEKDLSFVLTRQGSSEIIACALNSDLRDEPSMKDLAPRIEIILNFLEDCEASVRSNLPKEVGTVLHSFMMGTLLELGPAENVELIQIMECENLKVAARKGYKAVFTTNSSTLTQQVCDDLLSYKVLGDYQVNLWVAPDGSMPFRDAPDTQHAVSTVKFI